MSDEPIRLPAGVEPAQRAPSILFEHYCQHPDYKEWGAFGFARDWQGRIEVVLSRASRGGLAAFDGVVRRLGHLGAGWQPVKTAQEKRGQDFFLHRLAEVFVDCFSAWRPA